MAPTSDVLHAPTGDAVAAGNVVFTSGCTADQGDGPALSRLDAQVELALDRARQALESLGSSMDNVVKTLFLLTSLDDYGDVRRTETEFYERHAPQLVTTPPAATLMVVPGLALPELRVQYEAVAALDRRRRDSAVTYYPEFWGGRELAYPHVPKEHAKFARSQAIGDLLIVSGCQALDHGTVRVETDDLEAQSRIVLDKVRVAVEEGGGSLADLVKTNVFVKDADALPTYRDVEQAFFGEHAPEVAADPPASTAFVMSELPRPEFLIEVEAFAVVGDARSNGIGLLFPSGCAGTGDTVERQVSSALGELRGVLARAGSTLESVVKITLLLTDSTEREEMHRALLAYYGKHARGLLERPPATTFAQVRAIEPAGARFLVDAVAVA